MFGDLHPDTWTAYGHAIVAWGKERIADIAPVMPQLSAAFPLARRAALIEAQARAEREARDAPREVPSDDV